MAFQTLDANGAEKVALGTTVVTKTTTGDIFDLDFGNADVLRMNNASLATLRGLKAGRDGQTLTVIAMGAGDVDLAHNDAGNASASSRLTNTVTVGATPLLAGVGSATLRYDTASSRWRLVQHKMGGFRSPAYAGGNFFTSGGGAVWTVDAGDVSVLKFMLVDKMILAFWDLVTTSISGAGAGELRITVPYTVSGTFPKVNVGFNIMNSPTLGLSFEVGFVQAIGTETWVRILRPAAGTIGITTNDLVARGWSFFEVL